MFRFIALLALAMASTTLVAQKSDQLFTATQQQLTVTKVVLAQEAAWNRGDLDGYLNNFKDASDTTAMLATVVRGMENIRANYRLNFPNAASMGTLEQSDVEVRELGPEHALVTGKYALHRPRKNGGDTEGGFTEIMEKTSAGWRVIFSQTT